MQNSKEVINYDMGAIETVESTAIESFTLFDEIGEAMLAMERVANDTRAVEKATVGDWLPFLDLSLARGQKGNFFDNGRN
jgi:hypothetical protein